jgi:hypothetical protein
METENIEMDDMELKKTKKRSNNLFYYKIKWFRKKISKPVYFIILNIIFNI